MKKDELKERIKSLISEVTFTYNGERCGVDPFSAHDFDVWYGDKYEKMTDIDQVMNTPFSNGKTLGEIAPIIELDQD